MNAQQLRELQAPAKLRYRDAPEAAKQTLIAHGELAPDGIVCRVKTLTGPVDAGLHPATGGDGSFACSAEMLLEALVGCAGVTLRAVATALDIPLAGAKITAQGDLDFRGTLGVAKDAPVGLTAIRLTFDLDTGAADEQVAKLISLVERYCVVYQTLHRPPALTTTWRKET
jgi:uncharacterized OsmC-like protein